MNYYEHHLGDWAQATAHLSFIEDAAYSRCIRKYYADERPLPVDIGTVQRLVGARTREEREAVAVVLKEFFVLAEDGWRNKRCDEEIARYQDKRSKAKRSADARWNRGPGHADRSANASPDAMRTHMRTHTEGNALQTPDTRHQTPNTSVGEYSEGDGPPSDLPTDQAQSPGNPKPEAPPPPSDAGRACLALRGANVHDVNPQHPDLLRLLAAGVTPEAIGATAAEIVAAGKPARMAYVLRTVESRLQQPMAAARAPGRHAGFATKDYRAGVTPDGSIVPT